MEDIITSSYGGIDQGLNRTLAIVLLDEVAPREELLYDDKRSLLDKYDTIIASLQQAGKTKKLKQLRCKRYNVSVYHDWLLANRVAEYTDGYDIAIGNTRFKQTQYRGNGMPTLRKRTGMWSYARQRTFIAHKRAERGLSTWLLSERNTSNTCHCCGSRLVTRKYLNGADTTTTRQQASTGSRLVTRKYLNGASWILCHSCQSKLDADLNAAYNIAAREMTG
ncbi:hypothetical protein Mtc_1700 [Methanocella conradii HZ254]|uniref:Cas12f1-like TNB domain-containing protein n=1 Tax=Methanocella conradii (strain DSM 24694 / JCM 17849 / CGMCC 1.5162 / HZ254) TaxID=1041930 RepID=H8I8X5_METCZ|nr:zinc ribbon domain-containing protein [Methanocella conradii]AFD00446.1 hypothetical protein Mtc_1700 [Methanocella conradii HZ254]